MKLEHIYLMNVVGLLGMFIAIIIKIWLWSRIDVSRVEGTYGRYL